MGETKIYLLRFGLLIGVDTKGAGRECRQRTSSFKHIIEKIVDIKEQKKMNLQISRDWCLLYVGSFKSQTIGSYKYIGVGIPYNLVPINIKGSMSPIGQFL